MRESVLLQTLRDQRRGLIGWSIGQAALIITMVATWPSVRDLPGIEEFAANYPEPLRELFNLDAITTARGFLNAELYSLMLPTMFLIFGIARGARTVAGEEEAGSLELIVTTPLSRTRVLRQKALGIALSVGGLAVTLSAVSIAATSLTGMEVGIVEQLRASAAVAVLGITHGLLALAVGAATGRRAVAMGVAASVAVVGYVLYILGELVDWLSSWQTLSPFTLTLDDGPLAPGLPPAFVLPVLAGIVVIAAAGVRYERRDLAV